MMSELTKVFEKLEAWRASPKTGQLGQVDEVHGWRNPVELREHEVDELLALRTLRDAGDEEVEKWHKKIKDAIQIDYFDSDWDNAPTVLIDKLRDIVITRGQQLRVARAEIERLKGDAERYRWLRSHSWHEPYHIFFGPGCNQLEPHHLDQAIDNEMKYPIIEGEKT